MKRFRFTLLAVCLVLAFLGWKDVSLFLSNPEPATLTIEALENQGPPREWLHVTGGYQNLEQAISTSGTIELDALLVPLSSAADPERIEVLVETRNPQLMELFKTYHFKLDSVFAKEEYLEKHRADFHGQRDITGMLVGGLIATGNRDKLFELARQSDLQVAEDVIFLSEGKTPPHWRGFFFLGVGLLGLIKVVFAWKKPAEKNTGPSEE